MYCLHINIDGGSRGNPGQAATGLVVADNDEVIHQSGRYLGLCSNNVAEYQALIDALLWLRWTDRKPDQVILYSDSELIVKQVLGKYKVKQAHLQVFYQQVKFLLDCFDYQIEIKHIKRDKNKAADSLVNSVLDTHQN